MALDWQTLQIGFGAGLNTKDDARFSSPPALDIARDVQFEEIGGLQLRKPFVAMGNTIFGGGTLSSCRRPAVVNDELLVLTDTALFSWSPELAKWILRATDFGVAIDWRQPVSTNGDQIAADRAELNGTVIYCWSELGLIYISASSKVTGAAILGRTLVDTGNTARLVVLSTKIVLFHRKVNGNLMAYALDPADPEAGIANPTVVATSCAERFDVVRHAATDKATGVVALASGTSHVVFAVSPALALTTSTKVRAAEAVAIAVVPGVSNRVHVFRSTVGSPAGTISGDVINTTALADVTINQTLGEFADTCAHLTACYRSVASGGHYTCAVFWTGYVGESYPSTSPDFACKTNTITEAGTIGTAATFLSGLVPRSRAFDVGGSVFVHMLFDGGEIGQLNNGYFLFRDDRTLHGKAVTTSAGGLEQLSMLPEVTNTDGTMYRWAASVRRALTTTTNNQIFAARSVVDISIAFDSDSARRTAQIGFTGYLSGAQILQYDSMRLVEVGFEMMPTLAITASSVTTAIVAGAYGYKSTYGYQNGKGEAERSSTFDYNTHTVVNKEPEATVLPLYVTRKTASPPAVEIWRTTINPPTDAPYYLVTSRDPNNATNPNRYLANVTTGIATWRDNVADPSANVPNPENGDVLESLVPPGATIVVATDTRLYLGGVAGDPDRVWASRERGDGEIVGFHDALTIDVPRPGGTMTAVWIMDDVLYVGRQYAIYAIPGAGFDNTGRGQGWGPSQAISLDLGPVSQEAIALTPLGMLMFTAKGWYLLDHGRSLRYVGGAVNAFDGDTVRAMLVVSAQHQVRILTSNRMLVWDYRGAVDAAKPDGIGQWAEWTITGGLGAVMWRGTCVYLTTTGPLAESTPLTGLTYALDVETSWIKPHDLAGFAKLGAIIVTGEYRSACLVRVRLARDYLCDTNGDATYFDDRVWPPSPTSVAGPMQIRHVPSSGNSNVEAIKVRITAVAELARATLETVDLLGPSAADFSAVWIWTSTWQAKAAFPGVMGNAIAMSLTFEIDEEAGTALLPYAITVRDHFYFDPVGGRWRERMYNVGILVSVRSAGSVDVATLQTAIGASTNLLTMTVGDPDDDVLVPVAGLVSYSPVTVAASGGTYAPPTGEGFKLTGLGMDVGLHRGLYKRLPAAQKQ